MRRFLIKISGFIILFVLAAILVAAYNYTKWKYELLHIKEVETLIMGDSHSLRGINPSYFEKGYNVSNSAEPYVITYWKYKEILKYQQPKMVVVSVSPHNLSGYNDLKFSHGVRATEMFKRTCFYGDYKSLEGRIKINEKKRIKVWLKEVFIIPKMNHLSVKEWGGYVPLKRSFNNDSQMAIKRHYYFDSLKLSPSKVQIAYLDSIVKLSEKKNIEVVMVGLPLHSNYANKIPIEYVEAYKKVKTQYKDEVTFIDMSFKHDFAELEFLDSDHLNQKGAEKASLFISEKLKSIETD